MECTTVSLWMSGWCVLPVWWGSVFVGWHQERAHAPTGEDSQGPTAGSGYQVMLWNPISDRTHLSDTFGRNIWTSTGWSTSFSSAGILAARILVQNGAKRCPAHKTMFMMPVILCRRSLVSKKLAVSSALENLPYECYDYSSVSIHSNTMKIRTFVAMDMQLSESPDKISLPVQASFAQCTTYLKVSLSCEYELWKLHLNLPSCAIAADSISRLPHSKKAYFHCVIHSCGQEAAISAEVGWQHWSLSL